MPSLHRRTVLRAVPAVAGVGLAATAGCASEESSTPTPTATERPTVDYDALFVRNPANESFVEYTDEHGETESNPDSVVLSTVDAAERVSLSTTVDGADDARRFLKETDFSTETVHLSELPVGECYELVVDSVTTTEDSFDLDFCRRLRPADVACATDSRDVVLSLVRFPYATDDPRSYTVGHGGSCDHPERGDEG